MFCSSQKRRYLCADTLPFHQNWRAIIPDESILNSHPNPVDIRQTRYIEIHSDDRLLNNAVVEVCNLFGQLIGYAHV